MSQKPSPLWPYSLPSAILLMAPFDLLSSLAMDVYLPVLPQMPAALNSSTTVVQLTLSVYMLVLGLGQLFFGPLADRIGRRPVVLAGALLFCVASFALAMTSNGPLFVGLRILQALGASATLVATFATVRDVYANSPESTVIYSLFGAMLACVPALGPLLGAAIAEGLGWRAIFVLLGSLGLLALGQALYKWHETCPPRKNRQAPVVRTIVTSACFWVHTLGFSTAMGAFFVFFSTASHVLIERLGLSPMAFSVVFASVALVMIASTRLSRSWVVRWGIEGSLMRGLLVIFLAAVLLALCTLYTQPSVAGFVLPMWLMAVGIVWVVSVTANGALREFGHAAGTAVALYYSLQSLIVAGVGTALVIVLGSDSAWPLITYCLGMVSISALALTAQRYAMA